MKVGESMCKKTDFDNISYCEVIDSKMTYRKQKKYFWQRFYYDGGVHSIPFANTHNIENGFNYTFRIYYKNGRAPDTRTYHESSYMCRLLSEKVKSDDITEAWQDIEKALNNLFSNADNETTLKKYYKSCQECLEEEAKLFNYSKQQLLEEVRKEYSEEEIQKALTQVNIDFNEQAVRAAQDYLDIDNSYTYEMMVEELLNDKFTKEEAEYAVNKLKLLLFVHS